MLGGVHTTVMDTTSGYDRNIAVLSDIEIIVYHILQTALTQKNRNMHTLIFCSRFNDDIDSRLILFCYNIYICSCISAIKLSVDTNIKCALRYIMKSCYLLQ